MSKVKITHIGCAEYGVYYLGEDKKVRAYKPGLLLTPYALEGVIDVSAGMHNAGVVTDKGLASIIFKPTPQGVMNIRSLPLISGAVKVFGLGGSYIFLTNTGEAWHSNESGTTDKLKTNGRIIQAACGSSLFLRNDQDEVYEYHWSSGSLSPTQTSQLSGVKLIIGAVEDLDASYNGFAVMIVGGVPYGYGYNWGYLGMVNGHKPNTPATLKDTWGMAEKVIQVKCNHETTHMITTSGKLFGQGDNIQGGVGNGEEHPFTKLNKRTNGVPQALMVKKPVHIGVGRTYEKICKGDTLAFYAYALETNGIWNFWGRVKAGVSGMGLFGGSNEDVNPNWGDILKPWRVEVPDQAKSVDILNPGTYPPTEYMGDIVTPPPPPPITVIKEFTLQLMSDGTLRLK